MHDESIVETLGDHFGVHPLAMEDIVNTGQRPKMEEGDGYLFLVIKMLYRDPGSEELLSEQVSVLFGEGWVITLQEDRRDVFTPVRERIRRTVPRERFMKADYLAYALLDAVVDHYFVVLEKIGEQIEDIEEALVSDPGPDNLNAIQGLKKDLIFMRKSIWPLREVVSALERIENKYISDLTRPYLRDLYEHIIQAIDTVETFRDMVSGLLDIYLSSVSNRMNEVMKVLTIIATIFIPLGFLAGVYGMNFDTGSPFNMPELGFRFGYLVFWGLALVIAGGMFWYFRRRRWL